MNIRYNIFLCICTFLLFWSLSVQASDIEDPKTYCKEKAKRSFRIYEEYKKQLGIYNSLSSLDEIKLNQAIKEMGGGHSLNSLEPSPAQIMQKFYDDCMQEIANNETHKQEIDNWEPEQQRNLEPKKKYGGSDYGGTVNRTVNPNRHECIEACKRNCPDPVTGSAIAAQECARHCVNKCWYSYY